MFLTFNYNALYIIPVVVVLVALYAIFYLVNKKVKRPEDCPKEDIGCASCMLSCNSREEEFSIKEYFFKNGTRKLYVPLEGVKPLKKKELEIEQKKFIEEMKKEKSIK